MKNLQKAECSTFHILCKMLKAKVILRGAKLKAVGLKSNKSGFFLKYSEMITRVIILATKKIFKKCRQYSLCVEVA